MNYHVFNKVLALPLSTTENSIACVLSKYTEKNGFSCFPSYETISKESGASNKTISKCIRVLRYAKVIEFKNRADIIEGKKSNEYTFIFDSSIGFFRDSLSKANQNKFKKEIKACREKVKQEMTLEAIEARTAKIQSSIPSHNDVPNTSQMLRKGKSQSVNNDVRDTQRLDGVTIPSHISPIPSQMLRRSIRENVLPALSNTNDSHKSPCNMKSQKMAWHEKENNFVETINQDSSIDNPAKQKDPSKQTNDEWLADLEKAEQKFK